MFISSKTPPNVTRQALSPPEFSPNHEALPNPQSTSDFPTLSQPSRQIRHAVKPGTVKTTQPLITSVMQINVCTPIRPAIDRGATGTPIKRSRSDDADEHKDSDELSPAPKKVDAENYSNSASPGTPDSKSSLKTDDRLYLEVEALRKEVDELKQRFKPEMITISTQTVNNTTTFASSQTDTIVKATASCQTTQQISDEMKKPSQPNLSTTATDTCDNDFRNNKDAPTSNNAKSIAFLTTSLGKAVKDYLPEKTSEQVELFTYPGKTFSYLRNMAEKHIKNKRDIFILGGGNNIQQMSFDDTKKHLEELIAQLKNDNPGARIIFCLLPPRGWDPKVNQSIIRLNNYMLSRSGFCPMFPGSYKSSNDNVYVADPCPHRNPVHGEHFSKHDSSYTHFSKLGHQYLAHNVNLLMNDSIKIRSSHRHLDLPILLYAMHLSAKNQHGDQRRALHRMSRHP